MCMELWRIHELLGCRDILESRILHLRGLYLIKRLSCRKSWTLHRDHCRACVCDTISYSLIWEIIIGLERGLRLENHWIDLLNVGKVGELGWIRQGWHHAIILQQITLRLLFNKWLCLRKIHWCGAADVALSCLIRVVDLNRLPELLVEYGSHARGLPPHRGHGDLIHLKLGFQVCLRLENIGVTRNLLCLQLRWHFKFYKFSI